MRAALARFQGFVAVLGILSFRLSLQGGDASPTWVDRQPAARYWPISFTAQLREKAHVLHASREHAPHLGILKIQLDQGVEEDNCARKRLNQNASGQLDGVLHHAEEQAPTNITPNLWAQMSQERSTDELETCTNQSDRGQGAGDNGVTTVSSCIPRPLVAADAASSSPESGSCINESTCQCKFVTTPLSLPLCRWGTELSKTCQVSKGAVANAVTANPNMPGTNTTSTQQPRYIWKKAGVSRRTLVYA